MSSNDKRDLTTKANDGAVSEGKGKAVGAENTVTGDIVTLPPDADDVIFSTICDSSVTGTVDAELEMSYDKENWCPAVTEEYTEGESVVGWGNEQYVLTKVADQDKNKHGRGVLNFDTSGTEVESGGTRDVLFDFIQRDKPFNFSWWHKSEDQPHTVVDVPADPGHTKYFAFAESVHTYIDVSNIPNTIIDSDKDWTLSMWYKSSDTDDVAYLWGMKYANPGFHCYWSSGNLYIRRWTSDGNVNIEFTDLEATVKDGNWHHLAFTFKQTASGGTAGDWYLDPISDSQAADAPGLTLYVDGSRVARDSGSTGSHTGALCDSSDAGEFRWGHAEGGNYANSWDGQQLAIFNEFKTANEISDIYHSGEPINLRSDTGCISLLNAQDNTSNLTGTRLADGETVVNSAAGSTASSYVATASDATGASYELHVEDATGESIYVAPVTETRKNNYNPIIFRHGNKDPFTNGKHLNLLPDAGNNEKKNKHLHAPVNVGLPNTKYYKSVYGSNSVKTTGITTENIATGSSPIMRYDRDWTISWWQRSTYNNYWFLHGTRDGTANSDGEGWENEFSFANSNNHIYLKFTDSSGTQVAKSLYHNGGNMNGNLADGEWHFIAITFNANGATSGDFELQPSNALHSNTSSPDSQRSMTVYINGQPFNNDAIPVGGSYHNVIGTVSDCEITSGDRDWEWVSQASGNNAPTADVNQLAVFNEYLTASEIAALYDSTVGSTDSNGLHSGGNPKDVTTLSSCKVCVTFEDDTYSNTDTSAAEFTNAAFSGAWSSDPYPSSKAATYAGASIESLTSTDHTYVPLKDIFDSKLGADKSFTINKWFKSDHNPTNWTTASTASYTPTKYLSFNISDVLQEGTASSYYARSKCEPTDSISNFENFTPFFNNTNGFTYSCWFKTFGVWDKHMWGEASNRFGVTIDGDFEHYWAYGSNSILVKWDARPYLTNEWFHLMLVYEGTASYTADGAGTCYKLYINNELVPQSGTPTIGGTPNISTDTGTTGEWGLMGRNTHSESWQGGMSDYTVWNKALSTSERAALYNNHGVVDVANLSFFNDEDCGAWIKLGSGADDAFNEGENAHSATNRMQDYSGNGNHYYPYVPSSQNYMDENELKTTDLPPTAPTVYTDDYLPVLFNNGAKITTSSTTGVSGCMYLPFQYADTSTFKMGTVADFNDDSDNFYFARTSSKFTISFWAKFRHLNSSTTMSAWKYIFDSGHDTVSKGFAMLCQGDEFHAGFFNAMWVRGHVGADMTGWDDGNWHHIAVTYDGPGLDSVGEGSLTSYLKIYKNGDLQTTTATTYGTWLDSAGNDIDMECQDEAVFGHAHSDYSNQKNLEAFYTHIAIWKTDLTATQIDTIYNNGKPNDISGIESSDLKRYYKFDSQDGTDSAGNHTGTFGTYTYGGKIAKTENIYVADTSPEDTFGNGLTASLTKKLGSGTTWNPAGTETTKLLLSFDGFEDGADAFNAYDASSLLDGNWHNLQITYKGAPTEDTPDTDTEDVKVFVDGAELSISDSGNNKLNKTAANKHFKYTTGTFVPGTFGASGWKETSSSTDYAYAFQGAFDQLSLHSEGADLTKAKEFYGKGTIYEGQPHNYQLSTSLTYANVEGWWTFDEDGDFTSGTANDKTSNNIDLTLKYFDSNGNNLTNNVGESVYIAPTGRIIGEGFTVSITKNLKDDGTWVTTQDETTRLVLSFNGVESLADHFVAYDVNQTGLSDPTNLLDGLWHNVVISFQGTTNNSGTIYLDDNEIRFGPVSQGSADQAYHIAVSFDGHKLTGISPLGAVDDGSGGTLSGITGWNVSKKLASGKMEAGFIIEQKDLRHVNSAATYVPTTYLASGIVEADGADSIYAFQGGFDESSFHSDNWWVDESGDNATPTQYNAEKAKTIYGNTGGLAPAQQSRRSPYDLLDPSSIGAASGSNQYVNPNPYDASSNPSGGVEVYYRWGDTTGDCSSSVNDVRSKAADSNARDISVSLGSMTHSTALDTDASGSTDFEKDLTYNDSGTYKMYVEKSTSTTEGGLNTKNVKISGCAASKCQQQGVLAPKLPHMRVKWTGSGSCDLGEDKCRAQLWFRRRKK